MVSGGVVLCEIIGQVVSSAAPVDEELSLLDSVFDPVETHVNGFGAALLHIVVSNPSGTGVVCLDWSGVLWVAHAFESGSKHRAIFGIIEKGSQFGFGGR